MARKKQESYELRAPRFEQRVPLSPTVQLQRVPLAPPVLVPARTSRLATRGFTLTELLVVITIIAILASLITAGAMNALNASKRARITTEINQLSQAMEEFKTRYSLYPPNGMNDDSTNYAGNLIYSPTIKDFERTFKKAFPRSKEPLGLIQRLGGATGNLPAGNPSALDEGLNAAEAVYFWLGGFSEDPEYPISGPGGPSFADGDDSGTTLELSDEVLESRNADKGYAFELTRLGPRNDNAQFNGRFITYIDPKTGQDRQINLWTYTPAGSERPYLYFDASRHDPVDYDLDLSGVSVIKIYALKKLREGFSSSAIPAPKDIVFVNKNKFQILHSGLDDAWGDMSPFSIFNSSGNVTGGDASGVILFPSGPFTGDIADTLTNFTSGTLESAQE